MRIPLTDGEVDLDARVALRSQSIDLTPREVELLRHLATHTGAVTLQEILTQVWGYAASSRTQAVHVAVRRLRQKIEVDPSHPVHLITVAGVGWKLVPAAARLLATRVPTRLVGRHELLAALLSTVEESPLVTLIGPGGIGKTSIARALLADTQGRFVDLTAARTSADVSGQVLEGHDPACLAGDLVVLDNVEQVAEVCAELIAAWLEAVPSARFVATSRIPLRLNVEHIVRVGPLSQADAVDLFERRCGAFGAKVVDDPAVADLVEALDCNPLALELAAARTPLLSPAQLLERGTGVLRSRQRDQSARHTSLDEVVAWSFHLLSDSEQEALRQLMTFVGGFSLEAAEAVVRVADMDALDAVHGLLDASLLRELEGRRFAPWVAVSSYLREQPSEEALARHLQYYAGMGAALRQSQGKSPAILGREAGNLRIALGRALETNAVGSLADLCVGVGEAAAAVVHAEAIPLIERARERLPANEQAAAAYGHARALSRIDPIAGAAIAEEGTHALGEAGWRAHILVTEMFRDAAQFVDAHAAADRALAAARTPSERVEALVHRATSSERMGDGDAAWADIDEAWALDDVDETRRTLVLSTRAVLKGRNQDFDGAEEDYAMALQRYVAAGDVVNAGILHSSLATIHNYQGRHTEAVASAESAIACFTEIGWQSRFASPLMVISNVRRMEGKLDEAAQLLGRAANLARRTGNRTAHATAQCHLAQVRRQQKRFDEAERVLDAGIATLTAVGARHRLVELVTLRGEIALDQGHTPIAVAALTEAEDLAEGLPTAANARRTIQWLRDRLTREA